MDQLVIGQKRISKLSFPNVGHYTIEIISMDGKISIVRFTAELWEDHHWVDNCPMYNLQLLDNYEIIND